MSDINKMAKQITQQRLSQAAQEEARKQAESQQQLQRSQQVAQGRAEVLALCQQFYSWTRRHKLPPDKRSGMVFGWNLAETLIEVPAWKGEGPPLHDRYFLVVNADGTLGNAEKFSSVKQVERGIAEIVSRFGVAWD